MAQTDLSIRFWGVRGSIPCPGPETVRYGGNTSCVEIRCGRRLMIFDGGSGLRPLGKALIAHGRPVDLDLFYTHTHLDHIVGLPFFAPAYSAGTRIRFWAGHLKPAGSDIKAVLEADDDAAAVPGADRHPRRASSTSATSPPARR